MTPPARHNRRLTLRSGLALVLAALLLLLAAPAPPAQAQNQAQRQADTLPEDAQLDLFLLIGQSNMAGRGKLDAASEQTHPRVWTLTKEDRWAPARDPIHFDKPQAGVGLGVTFGTVLAERQPDAVIGLIPSAVGGSSIDQWARGERFYNEAVRRAREAMQRGTLKGILWHQGEADVRPERRDAYPPKLRTLIENLRNDLDAPDVPFIVGHIAFNPRPRAPFVNEWRGNFNRMLDETAPTVPHAASVSADNLTTLDDGTHFDTAALRELGRRYAEAYTRLTSDTPAPAPTPQASENP